MPSTAPSPTRPDALPSPPGLDLAAVALFADLDGTLAPIEATPDAVRPDAGRRRLLQALSKALHGRVAVVSGRALADIDRVLEGRLIAVAAVHGLVRRRADGCVLNVGGAVPRSVLQALGEFAARDAGLLVEDKGAAAALHFRAAPTLADASRALARRLAADHDLAVQQGDMVIELRAPGPDKGDAVEAFMAEPPFAGHMPVFLGDDLTDEAGFRAAQRLGGFGVVVGRRRPTAARYALPDVGAAQAWLRNALETAA